MEGERKKCRGKEREREERGKNENIKVDRKIKD